MNDGKASSMETFDPPIGRSVTETIGLSSVSYAHLSGWGRSLRGSAAIAALFTGLWYPATRLWPGGCGIRTADIPGMQRIDDGRRAYGRTQELPPSLGFRCDWRDHQQAICMSTSSGLP